MFIAVVCFFGNRIFLLPLSRSFGVSLECEGVCPPRRPVGSVIYACTLRKAVKLQKRGESRSEREKKQSFLATMKLVEGRRWSVTLIRINEIDYPSWRRQTQNILRDSHNPSSERPKWKMSSTREQLNKRINAHLIFKLPHKSSDISLTLGFVGCFGKALTIFAFMWYSCGILRLQLNLNVQFIKTWFGQINLGGETIAQNDLSS